MLGSQPTLLASSSHRCGGAPAPRRGQRQHHVTRASLDSVNRHWQNQQLQSFKLYGKHVRQQRVDTARQYFEEVVNASNLDLLEEMVVEHVVYNEKNIYNEDYTGRKRLRRIVAEYQQAYPTMQYTVESATCDEYGDVVIVCWSATGSNLGSRMNLPASGRCSSLSGMTQFRFTGEGQISEIVIFRTSLAEEGAAVPIDWE